MVLLCGSRKLGIVFALNMIDQPSLGNYGSGHNVPYSDRGIEQEREALRLGRIQSLQCS